jgi:hypothetical protein
MQEAVARLADTPAHRIKPEHPDCRELISLGVESLLAQCQAVRAEAKTWIHLHHSLACVAEGLGKEGRDAVARLLCEATCEHELRMVRFLDHAASKMDASLCQSLAKHVTFGVTESFGHAAAHHGRRGASLVTAALLSAPTDNKPVLRDMLTALFASASFEDTEAWLQALGHQDAWIRAAAVAADLGKKGGGAEQALTSDPEEAVRFAFASKASYIPKDALLRLADDESPRVRAAAISLLDGEPDAKSQLTRWLNDPHPQVALAAAVSLEDASVPGRILAGLHSPDPEVKRDAAGFAGLLPKDSYLLALLQLERDGDPQALAAAAGSCEPEPEPMRAVAELARRSPHIEVLRAAAIHLAFTQGEAATDAAALLLDASLPARVRRAGFYAMSSRREAWPRFLEPLLRPDEPLVQDLISELHGALVSDAPVDRGLFERLKSRYPGTRLEDLANRALKTEDA